VPALIDSLGFGPAHVPGLSWGGTVVLEACCHHPEHVAMLTRPAEFDCELAPGGRPAEAASGVAAC
jgi:pimeloyl-ACP methyl ester carboxylesterase